LDKRRPERTETPQHERCSDGFFRAPSAGG
jgi:hypothetical protein